MTINVTVEFKNGSYNLVVQSSRALHGLKLLTGRSKVNIQDLRALEHLGHDINYSEYARDALAGRL